MNPQNQYGALGLDADVLKWSKLKFEQGLSHLERVKKIEAEWGQGGHIWLEHSLSENGHVISSVLRVSELPPMEKMSLVLGDALHNFRSSLDFLVWSLSNLDGRSPAHPRSVYFPCVLDKKSWPKKSKSLEAIPINFLNRIADVQPFNANGEITPLQLLVELSNQDKHREILSSIASASTFSVDISTQGKTNSLVGGNDDFQMQFLHPELSLLDGKLFSRMRTNVPVDLLNSQSPMGVQYQVKIQDIVLSMEDLFMGLESLSGLINYVFSAQAPEKIVTFVTNKTNHSFEAQEQQ